MGFKYKCVYVGAVRQVSVAGGDILVMSPNI